MTPHATAGAALRAASTCLRAAASGIHCIRCFTPPATRAYAAISADSGSRRSRGSASFRSLPAGLGRAAAATRADRRRDLARRRRSRFWLGARPVPDASADSTPGSSCRRSLARFVPFVANARMPGRAQWSCVFMALAVLRRHPGCVRRRAARTRLSAPGDAMARHRRWSRSNTGTRRSALTLLDSAGGLPGARPRPPPGPCARCRSAIGDGLSVGVGSQDRRVLFCATQHEHPLAGGYIEPHAGRTRRKRYQRPCRLQGRCSSAAVADAHDRISGHWRRRPCRAATSSSTARPARQANWCTYPDGLPAERIASDDDRATCIGSNASRPSRS